MELHNLTEGENALRQDMNRWVAQFAPLVMENAGLVPEEITERIELIQKLRAKADRLMIAKSSLSQPDDAELLNTFQLAVRQLPQMESDLRRQLHLVAPGDPESRPCLTALQDRLQENAARQEVGLNSLDHLDPIEANTAEPSASAALGLGIFALGWNGFTIFHATMMLGSMLKSFGFLALLMGLFYLPFFAVGLLMIAGVVFSLCRESIRLEGNKLTVTYRWGPFTYLRKHEIDIDQLVKQSEVLDSDTNKMRKQDQIQFTDIKGKPVRLARGLSESARTKLIKKLNAHLLSARHHAESTALAS